MSKQILLTSCSLFNTMLSMSIMLFENIHFTTMSVNGCEEPAVSMVKSIMMDDGTWLSREFTTTNDFHISNSKNFPEGFFVNAEFSDAVFTNGLAPLSVKSTELTELNSIFTNEGRFWKMKKLSSMKDMES